MGCVESGVGGLVGVWLGVGVVEIGYFFLFGDVVDVVLCAVWFW